MPPVRLPLLLLGALLPASGLGAQNVVLFEDFSTGVPPAGWTTATLGIPGGWVDDPFNPGQAFHDDYWGGMSDSWLVSPEMDLTNMSQVWLHADQNVFYDSWRLHHWIEVSTDGGRNWTKVHDETSPDGDSVIRVDLSDYAGLPSVMVAFHYEGDYASEWRIDNVVVDDQPVRILKTAVHPATGVPYYLLEASGWQEARAAAEALGGHLVTMEGASENDWVLQVFGDDNGSPRQLWIGLTDALSEGDFRWIDGQPLTWTNWAPGQPDNGTTYGINGEDYVRMYGSNAWEGPGLWSDVQDSTELGWIPDVHGVVEVDGPMLQVGPITAGSFATFDLRNFGPGDWAVIAWSNTGNGPTPSRVGDLFLSEPILTFPSMQVDAEGNLRIEFWFGPETLGIPYWFQALDYEALDLTNGVFKIVQ